VTAVTIGELFWPLSHVDTDFWLTVLVCVDFGVGPVEGGDWAHAGMGWVRTSMAPTITLNPYPLLSQPQLGA